MQVFIYILRCSDGSYYVGNTRRALETRLSEHNLGVLKGYTSSRRPVELVYAEYTDSLLAAFQRERQLKGWTRRKKEALISGAPELLPELSRRIAVQRRAGQA